jgi:SET domain
MDRNDASHDTVDYVSNFLLSRSGLVVASKDEKGDAGIFVRANKDICRGTNVMSCSAASIALDPPYRHSCCAMCARRCPHACMCTKCHMVTLCFQCRSSKDDNRHYRECDALLAIFNLFATGEEENKEFITAIDSCHLLTIRLLCQKDHLDWKIITCLHSVSLSDDVDSDIAFLCSGLLAGNVPRLSWINNEIYKWTLSRVIGCSHAITDLSLPMGSQAIGQALFTSHSFYNHSCTPNAFLSCVLMIDKPRCQEGGSAGVVARLHMLYDVTFGEEITISYIPSSGLGFQERQKRLHKGYEFTCICQACVEKKILLPPDTDVDSIRQIQFTCNEKLLLLSRLPPIVDEIERIVSLIKMTSRGINNQKIPKFHEVAIEVDRLLAIANSLLGRNDEAVQNHTNFFSKTSSVLQLIDPVATATQRIQYSKLLEEKEQQIQIKQAISDLQSAIGLDHPWILMLKDTSSMASISPVAKKQKVAC